MLTRDKDPGQSPGACQNFQITRGDGPVKHPEKGGQPGDSWAGMGPLLDYAGETGTGDRGVAEAVCDHPVGARGLLERVGDRGAGQPEQPGRFRLSGKRREVGRWRAGVEQRMLHGLCWVYLRGG